MKRNGEIKRSHAASQLLGKRLANGDFEHGFAVVAEVTAFEVPLALHVKVNGLQRRVKKKVMLYMG